MRELTSKYRTAETLGKGGMGKVFRGEMTGIEGFSRVVAIKMLRGLYDGHEPARARFAREAKICGTLRHRNVVSVLDFERSDAGEPFLVMEYVDGADLRMLMKCTPISIDASVYIVAEVLCALAYAHGQRVIHRDVKPGAALFRRPSNAAVVSRDFTGFRGVTFRGAICTTSGAYRARTSLWSALQRHGPLIEVGSWSSKKSCAPSSLIMC